MIRQLARCPYCNGCEIALDDRPELVFDPDTAQRPCPHLAWVEARYSEWELGPHGVRHMIGSTEFRWDPPEPGAEERTNQLLPYLKELLESGPDWPYAPAQAFSIQTLCADEKDTAPRGKTDTVEEVDGWAVFASDPAAFWAALPACQERQLAALDVQEGS
jgi:hypothetical protein